MKILLLLILTSILFFPGCNKSPEPTAKSKIVIDDIGEKIEFQKPPERIISLAPNITEMIYDLGLGKYVVGNTLYCNYPEAARKVEKVGDMLTYNYEKIVKLKPDLIFIVVEGNTKETYNKFKSLGLKLFVANPRNYESIKKTYLNLGKIFKLDELANKTVSGWDSTVLSIKKKTKSFNKSAMFLVEMRSLILAGKKSFIHEYMEFCGLKNIAGDSPLNYPIFNREEILKRNPDYIIYPDDGSTDINEIMNAYPEWKELTAVKKRQIIFVNRDLYSRPGPRFVDALKDLFTRLQGE